MKDTHPDFVAELNKHGLTYIMIKGDKDNLSSFTGSSWKSAFKTDDKKVAEERAGKMGTKLERLGSSAKVITGPVLAIRFDEKGHWKTWFNSLAVTYSVPESERIGERNTWVELGNGDPVDEGAIKDLLKIMKEESVAIPWKKGDVLLVKNNAVLHSRRLSTADKTTPSYISITFRVIR